MDKPGTIFNVDESGMNLELRKGKVVIDRSQKHAYSQGEGSREHVTVNCCVSPGRLMVPPFIIYEKSFPSGNYSANGPTDALYGKSNNGYMDEDPFFKWFTRLFVPKTKHVGKRILIIDGHGSHINLNLIDAARENQVILYCLPPHTTHVLQPLDVGLYSPLKTYFSRITDKIQIARLGIRRNVTISKTEFSAVFKLAYEETFSYARILSSFRSCAFVNCTANCIVNSTATCTVNGIVNSTATCTANCMSTLPPPLSSIASSTFPPPVPSIASSTLPPTASSNVPSTSLSPTAASFPGTFNYLPGGSISLMPSTSTNNRLPAAFKDMDPNIIDLFITPILEPEKKRKEQ
ncbi:uncharacterized protein LOC130628645 [Hydractinia symbiolongicarpus]|uniref:uncharacterized protein LOC130628645 n=1 Tax=Hydractinia symbiolongicarpus TaxID=13093 RepID=UPI00254DFD99|nr:uncharacterized protein LOC130628645 [Hydractinia symbiolongicarpus]